MLPHICYDPRLSEAQSKLGARRCSQFVPLFKNRNKSNPRHLCEDPSITQSFPNGVTLIVPTLNEAGNIRAVLGQIPASTVQEVLIVDGGSTDGTIQEATDLGHKVISEPRKGYGQAVLTGFHHSRGDVLITMDADGSHDPRHIPDLLAKLSQGYDVVLGSRYLPGAGSADNTWIRDFGNRLFTWLCNRLHGVGISDSLFLFAAVRRAVFEKCQFDTRGADFCMEIILRAHQKGFKIAEIPCFEPKRGFGESKINALFDGFKILLVVLKT